MQSPTKLPFLDVRPATLADDAVLSELAATVFREAYRSAFATDRQVEDFIATNLVPAVFRSEIAENRAAYWLGYVNEVPAGFLKLGQSLPPECVGCAPAMELSKLYVLRSFYGSGIANALMERGFEQAQQRGASQIWLCVWEKNARANAFYRRWGFEAVGETLFLWSGVEFRDLVMTRCIEPSPHERRRMKVDLPFADDAEIANLVTRFENGTWPYDRWTHHTHLAVGLSYARTMSFDAALDRLRRQINFYNQSCGDPAGYNETVTILFLRRICHEFCDSNDTRPLNVVVEELVRQCSVDWLYEYYSRDRIWSDAAKAGWIEPDRRPLDF